MELRSLFSNVYTKFQMHFYREVFGNWETKEATLTTVETFCMEVIHAMQRPTINEFASFIRISQPNAAYKVNSLVKKGYLQKEQSTIDKREYYLVPTQKYEDYYNVSSNYLSEVVARLEEQLTDQQKDNLREILCIMSQEIMKDIPVPFPEEESI